MAMDVGWVEVILGCYSMNVGSHSYGPLAGGDYPNLSQPSPWPPQPPWTVCVPWVLLTLDFWYRMAYTAHIWFTAKMTISTAPTGSPGTSFACARTLGACPCSVASAIHIACVKVDPCTVHFSSLTVKESPAYSKSIQSPFHEVQSIVYPSTHINRYPGFATRNFVEVE